MAPGLAYVAPEPIVAPAPIVRQRTSPTSYGLSEDAGFAGTSRPEQTLGQEAGRPERRAQEFEIDGRSDSTRKGNSAKRLVSRQFQGSAEWGGDQTDSAFLRNHGSSGPRSHAVMQRQTLSAVLN